MFRLLMEACCYTNCKVSCIAYLGDQYRARKLRAEQDVYTWPTIGAAYRSKHTKQLKMTPNDKTDAMAYLKELVLKMVDADAKRSRPQNDASLHMSGPLRTVPTLSHESIDPVAVAAKSKLLTIK
jgi:hypothetical protein